MRTVKTLTLVLIMLFILSLADISGDSPATSTFLNNASSSGQSLIADESSYFGTGSALTVSFTGTFTNASTWTQTSTTLSSEFVPGTSFSVTNSSTVTWTAYILVSPPPEVASLSFSVSYHEF